MQGGEFDADAWPVGERLVAGGFADGVDGGGVACLVAGGVVGGAGAFAEHVETVAKDAAGAGGGAAKGFVDGLAEDEMAAHDTHGLAHGAAYGGQAEAADDLAEDAFGGIGGADEAGGDTECPGGGAHEEGFRLVVAAIGEAALAEFILDEAVGGGVVGDAQQAFGEDHEGQAFRRGQGIFAQQGFDAADAAGGLADGGDEAAGCAVDAGFAGGGESGDGEEFFGQDGIVGRVGWPERRGHGFGHAPYAITLCQERQGRCRQQITKVFCFAHGETSRWPGPAGAKGLATKTRRASRRRHSTRGLGIFFVQPSCLRG